MFIPASGRRGSGARLGHCSKIPNYQSFLRGFTVSADGQRFVAVVETTPTEPQKFTTVLNWTSLVK